jgi:membrane protein YdbS with pleckstrin-like domain
MSRGYPAVWSFLLSLPFVGSGVYLYLSLQQDLELQGTTIPPSDLQLIGIPLVMFGGFVFLVGIYVQVAAPSAPTLREEEEIVDSRKPSQRVALSKIILSVPFFGMAAYWLFFTLVPYVYPTVVFVVGLYFFSGGIKTYWMNVLTSYYVTTKRVITEYRFISLRRQEIPIEKIRAIEERKSILEALVGLGNIRVASAGGGTSVQVKILEIGNSSDFADEIRKLTN